MILIWDTETREIGNRQLPLRVGGIQEDQKSGEAISRISSSRLLLLLFALEDKARRDSHPRANHWQPLSR